MKFFGTDGVRGTANLGHLSPESAMRLAQIATMELINQGGDNKPAVIIGKDTRRSGDMIENALAYAVLAAGIAAISICYERLLARIANDPMYSGMPFID